MPTTITTSTASTATAYSNQRKIDRTSNGVLWAIFASGGSPSNCALRYSTDNGATWQGTDNIASSAWDNGSLFIDQDDYAHVVYKASTDGYIYYRRGTPNVGRTSWTWSAAVAVFNSNTSANFPDIIAFRTPGASTWEVFVADAYTSGTYNAVHCWRSTIDATGTIGAFSRDVSYIGGSYGNSNHTYPSIDFHHTGDGKTVAGGTPHLYVAWSAGATGAGKGIRFRKATYSGGSWTWGTEREIDSARYVDAVSSRWLNCLFDGTRVMLVGSFTGTDLDIGIYERDAADTTTTIKASMATGAGNDRFFYGSASYDSHGNLYIFGQGPYSGASPRLGYKKWTRSTNTLEATVTVDSTIPDASTRGLYVSAKRGYSNNRIEYAYTDDSASPFNVTYDSIVLNQAPSVTLNTVGTFDPREDKTVSWTFSDPDGNTQTAYELDYRVSGGTWASLSTGTTQNSYVILANTLQDETDYELRVRANDGQVWSEYSTLTFSTDSWTTLTAVASTGATAAISTDGWTLGEHEVAVRVADADEYGAWSLPATVILDETAHLYFNGTSWVPVPKRIYINGEWRYAEPSF